MTRYTYDLFEPSANSDESLERLTREFAPLHMRSWEQSKKPHYDRAYDLNVGAFANMWLSKSLKIFMAYEAAKPVGFLMGYLFRPMQYNATTFQVEDWFTGNNQEVEDGLFDYLHTAMRFMGCDELLIMTDLNEPYRDIGPEWHPRNSFKMVRYVRGK